MRYVIIGAAFMIGLAGCGKSEQQAAQESNLPIADQKFDLKGMYPGMSKEDIEKVAGRMECLPSAQVVQELEANIREAENIVALTNNKSLSESDLPPPDIREKAIEQVKHKTSGQLDILRQLYTKTIDTACFIDKAWGLTYANLPADAEIGIKNGKTKTITLTIFGGKEEELLMGLSLKYKWFDGNEDGLQQRTNLMQIGLSMLQGIVDNRGNTLYMVQSPNSHARRLSLLDADYKAASLNAAAEAQRVKIGVKDM